MEWFEREAADGRLTVLCACEKRSVWLPKKDVRAGKAAACRDRWCHVLAAKMNEKLEKG